MNERNFTPHIRRIQQVGAFQSEVASLPEYDVYDMSFYAAWGRYTYVSLLADFLELHLRISFTFPARFRQPFLLFVS